MALTRSGINSTLYLLFAVCVLTLGTGAYWYVNDATNTREYSNLIMRTQSLAALINADDIAALKGDESDLTNPVYIRLKQQFLALKETNTDLEFLYLMAKDRERVYFLVDSEEPSSEDYSPPGQTYDEASEQLRDGWNPDIPYVLEIFEDRWGNFISVLAPVHDARGNTVALFGIDKDASKHRQVFLLQVGLIVFAMVLLLLLSGLLYRLAQSERETLEMKSDFLAAAAHELRSPLSGIRWALSALRNDATLSQPARQTVNEVHERVRGLVDLTNTFLLSASTDHGVMRPADLKVVDIAPTVAEAVQHSTMLARSKNIHIDVTFPLSDKIIVRADAPRLRLVFENLISNAVKYSPVGTTISIGYVDRGALREFWVKDQGIGIPKADQKKIFSGYHRAQNAAKSGILGSGFGLYMAKKIIDFHGGSIVVESSPGAGTTFHITIPSGL